MPQLLRRRVVRVGSRGLAVRGLGPGRTGGLDILRLVSIVLRGRSWRNGGRRRRGRLESAYERLSKRSNLFDGLVTSIWATLGARPAFLFLKAHIVRIRIRTTFLLDGQSGIWPLCPPVWMFLQISWPVQLEHTDRRKAVL